MKNKKASVTIIINIKLKFVRSIVLPKVYLNFTSVLAIKTFIRQIVLLSSVRMWSWGHMEFSGFTHPYNKIGSTIFYPHSCFYQLPMKFQPENTILHSVCMDILSQFHDSGLFLIVIECILTALLSQAIQVCGRCWICYYHHFPQVTP